jgi:hypothetical protein
MGKFDGEPKQVTIDSKDLRELIYWARRYCDGRSTYAPSSFNEILKNILLSYPNIEKNIQVDSTLTDEGKYWPWAQDGMYKDGITFDARYLKGSNENQGLSK